MNKHILFYSRNCKHSQKFIELKSTIDVELVPLCIDNLQIRKRLPKYVTRVPTIITYENGKKMSLTGKDAFIWLNKHTTTQQKVEIEEFDAMSSNISSTFSMLDSNQNDGIGNFASCMENESIYCPTDDGDKSSNTNYDTLISQRDADIPKQTMPTSKPDFEDHYDNSQFANKSQFDMIVSSRNNDVKRRGAVPKHQPNFQSGNFQQDPYFQTSGYQAPGEFGGRRGKVTESDFNRMKNQRTNNNFNTYNF